MQLLETWSKVKHARYYWLLLAEGHLTRRMEALAVPTG